MSLALVGDSSVWVIKPPTEYFEFGGAGQAASERLSPVVFPVRKMWSLRSGVCGELVFTQLWAVDKDHGNGDFHWYWLRSAQRLTDFPGISEGVASLSAVCTRCEL